MSKKLTKKEEAFCEIYARTLNGYRSYLEAYGRVPANPQEKNNIRGYACKILKKENVQERIKKIQHHLQMKHCVTKDRVIEELARIAFCDPRNFYEDDGTIKDITTIDSNLIGALQSFDIEEVRNRQGNIVGKLKKIKFNDKNSALEKLAKHLGLYEKDNEQLSRHNFILIPKKDD